MIVCPNCNHQNPGGASQCEACYTPLPVTASCSNCGAAVQTDAAFCGQCGFNLRPGSVVPEVEVTVPSPSSVGPTVVSPQAPDLAPTPPLMAMEPVVTLNKGPNLEKISASIPTIPDPPPEPPAPTPPASAASARRWRRPPSGGRCRSSRRFSPRAPIRSWARRRRSRWPASSGIPTSSPC